MVAGTPTPTLQSTPFFRAKTPKISPLIREFRITPRKIMSRCFFEMPSNIYMDVYLHNYRWFILFQNFINHETHVFRVITENSLSFWNTCTTRPENTKTSGWLAPSGTNKGWPKTQDQQGFFPIRTITTTRTFSIQNEHRVSLPFPKAPSQKAKTETSWVITNQAVGCHHLCGKTSARATPWRQSGGLWIEAREVCLKGRLGIPKIPKNTTGKHGK